MMTIKRLHLFAILLDEVLKERGVTFNTSTNHIYLYLVNGEN